MELGMLEQQVMLAILRLNPIAYGITIQQKIADCTDRSPSIGAIYATLDRLEQKGFVVSRKGEVTAERGGKRKLYFTLTAPGQVTLQRSLQALDSMRRGIRWKEARA